jgi:hypothetical protein
MDMLRIDALKFRMVWPRGMSGTVTPLLFELVAGTLSPAAAAPVT